MAKKNDNFFKRIFIAILLLLNLIVAIGLFFSFLAQHIPPSISIVFTYCGLFFPYLLFANLFFVVIWIFIRFKYLFISLSLLLLNVNNIDRYYQFRGQDKPEVCNNCVKVMSYNCKLFGIYNSDDKKQNRKDRNEIFNFIKEERPAILCLQEYFYDKSGKTGFNSTDTLLSLLNLHKRTERETRNYYYQHFPTNLKKEYYYGVAIFSKYKITNAGYIEMPDTATNNSAVFADIKFKNDTIRIYNLHLESFHIDDQDYMLGKTFLSGEINDPDLNQKALKLSGKMSVAYKKRALQVKAVRDHIKNSPYPVILCGDFNDTPVSYTYHTIGKGLDDTFRSSGKGSGVTYRGEALPAYRIDYIFHDKKYASYGHTICENMTVSDHYPIYSYISLKRR